MLKDFLTLSFAKIIKCKFLTLLAFNKRRGISLKNITPKFSKASMPNKSNLPYAVIFFGTFHDFYALYHDFHMPRTGSVVGMRHQQPRQAVSLWIIFWPFPDSSRIQNFITPTQTVPRLSTAEQVLDPGDLIPSANPTAGVLPQHHSTKALLLHLTYP